VKYVCDVDLERWILHEQRPWLLQVLPGIPLGTTGKPVPVKLLES